MPFDADHKSDSDHDSCQSYSDSHSEIYDLLSNSKLMSQTIDRNSDDNDTNESILLLQTSDKK